MIGLNILIERNGKIKPIESDNELRGLVEFINMYLSFGASLSEKDSQAPPTKKEEQATPRHGGGLNLPPVGERTIDYAIKAAKALNRPSFTLHELANKMSEFGWVTKATTTRERYNAIWIQARKGEFFEPVGNGLWRFKSEQPMPNGNGSTPARTLEQLLTEEDMQLQNVIIRQNHQ